MTGRGAGYCAGYPVPGYANPGAGFGFGRGGGWGRGRGGRGGGWGFRNRFYATGVPGWARAGAAPHPYYAGGPNTEQELEFLRTQAGYFETQLEEIKKRIEELQKAAAEQ